MTTIAPTSSIPSPLHRACNITAYCYSLPDKFPTVSDLLNDSKISESVLHPSVRPVLRVCLFYLSRVGECLNLTISDIFSFDRVICPGSKRGSAYLIYLPGLCSQLHDLHLSGPSVRLFPVTYMQCYRGCLKAGIRLQRPSHLNSPRTHIGRYLFSRGVIDRVPDSTLRDLLHHRSLQSQSYYL